MINNQVFLVEPMNPTNSLEGDHVIYEESEFSKMEYPKPLMETTEDEDDDDDDDEEPETNNGNENKEDEDEDEKENHDERDPESENEYNKEREEDDDEEREENDKRRRHRRRANKKTKYIELVVVNDKKFVDKMNGDLKAVENHVIQVKNSIISCLLAIL